jgi:hypothetical protein
MLRMINSAFVLMGVMRVESVCGDGGTFSCRSFVSAAEPDAQLERAPLGASGAREDPSAVPEHGHTERHQVALAALAPTGDVGEGTKTPTLHQCERTKRHEWEHARRHSNNYTI